MKRLLEWKQRMLQSPLNRKVNQNANKAYIRKSHPLDKLPDDYSHRNQLESYLDGTNTKNIPQYSSYSSDDEGKLILICFFFIISR